MSDRPGSSLIPAGVFWPVVVLSPGPWRRMYVAEDFLDQFAVALVDLVAAGHHRDARRLQGCCGPSGLFGPNRICPRGHEVGTERSDCLGAAAVYLDPALVQPLDSAALSDQ